MTVKHELRKLLWNVGFDVSRFNPGSHSVSRRRRLMAMYRVDVVLDVGANVGQFGQVLRGELGFRGRIVSFEPMRAAFSQLQSRASRDPHWEVFNFALGDVEGIGTINIAGNSYSSSILDMLPSHAAAAPDSRYVDKEEITIRTLDAIFDEVVPHDERVYLKIDTQGFEGRVLRGARRSLPKIDAVQLEMPLTPLYEGESSFIDLYEHMLGDGYTLVALESGFNDSRTGQLLQVDGVFYRR